MFNFNNYLNQYTIIYNIKTLFLYATELRLSIFKNIRKSSLYILFLNGHPYHVTIFQNKINISVAVTVYPNNQVSTYFANETTMHCLILNVY
jgi:hypothetical protein